MTIASDRRRGFTLVELLVTILLIAILAALTTGAVFRVLAGEKNRATESTLSKIETGLNRKRTAVLDDARDDMRQNRLPTATAAALLAAAGNDKDRAEVIWTYAKLKNEFPTTFQEARTAVILPGVATIPARSMFAQLPNVPLPTTPEQAARQSAACLYVSLTAAGVRGETMSLDGMNQQIADLPLDPTNPTAGTARMFVDSWGQPIAFFRMAFPQEVQGPPYLRGGVTNRDPCDPLGKLVQPTGGWDATRLNTFWAAVNLNQLGFGPPFNLIPATYPTPPAQPSLNWVATTVSAGPDAEWGSFFDGDNLIGFRTRREGARGD